MALATIGTDTGGSIRIPAAACGIVGLKPSLGEVSIDGVVPLSRTLDHVGPLAQSVADACLVYHALLGDPTKRPPAPMPMHGLRLAVPRRTSAICSTTRCAARSSTRWIGCARAGAHVDDIEIHHAADIGPIYLHLVLRDAAAYHAATLETMPERYTPPCGSRLEMGRYVLAEDYVRALAGRALLTREVDAALAQHDALVLPTLPIPAPPIGAATVELGGRQEPVRNVDAAADAALQRHRSPGDLDAVRAHNSRTACRRPARRRASSDRRAAKCRARLRAIHHDARLKPRAP